MKQSDKMFKEFVANLATQTTEIYLQSKEEYADAQQRAFETHDGLRLELEDYEHNLQGFEGQINELKQEVAQFKRWWLKALDDNRELKNELEEVRGKLEVQNA